MGAEAPAGAPASDRSRLVRSIGTENLLLVAGLLFGIGLAWWLLLSPSALGALLTLAGAIWEAAIVITRRRTPPLPSVAAEAS